MRLAILLAGVALASPALAGGYPPAPNPPHNGCGAAPQCGNAPKPGKPPKLVYEPVPPTWHRPTAHYSNANYNQNSNANSNWNGNQNSNSNTNSNRNSARAGARAGATAGASATGGAASIGNVSTGPSTATASNSNSNNADNSANLSSNVRVEGDTYVQARNRRIPVSTAYAAPLTSGIDTCLGSASAGVQTGILGVSLGGTKRDRICETIKLSRELHHMGMREGAVQLLCTDQRVRIAMRNAGTPCEEVTYAPPPMVYDEPPRPFVPAPPPRVRRRGERG